MARTAVDAVILDAGGVILHPNFTWLHQQAKRHRIDVSVVELHRAYYKMVHVFDLDPQMDRRGVTVDNDDLRRFIIHRLLVDAGIASTRINPALESLVRSAAEAFPRASDIYDWAMPGTLERLHALKASHFRLAVASNNDGALARQIEKLGATMIFDALVDSGIEGVSKPDAELLLRAAQRIGVKPARCLYVGDIVRVDGAAASAAGMHFALVDPLGQPREDAPLTISSLDDIGRLFVSNMLS